MYSMLCFHQFDLRCVRRDDILYEEAQASDGKSRQKHSFASLHAGCAPGCRGDASLQMEVHHSATSQDPGVGALHPCHDTCVFVLLSLLSLLLMAPPCLVAALLYNRRSLKFCHAYLAPPGPPSSNFERERRFKSMPDLKYVFKFYFSTSILAE